MKKNKKNKYINSKFDRNKIYSFNEAITILKELTNKKFNESLEAAINLNITPKKKMIIKGYSTLPYFIKKSNKIAIYSDNISDVDINKNDYIIFDNNTFQNINKQNINFDILLTTPSCVIKFGKISKVLSSKKIMPDVKYGTITTNIKEAIKIFKKNYVKYKSDKNHNINSIIGKINLNVNEIKSNIEKLILDIKNQKPKNCKNINIKTITLSTTMGPGIKINTDSIIC